MNARSPVEILDGLKPDELGNRIAELDRERRALVILRRAALAADRRAQKAAADRGDRTRKEA